MAQGLISDGKQVILDQFILAARTLNGCIPTNPCVTPEGFLQIARARGRGRDLPEEFG
ncbi:hypothetical protein [Ruegeria lacuscaerulensis]|uniref:hypothetical protein n=1 Tax=Ruegeria lacuscaerulensis TaxID=55218 RepID=UPI00147D2BC8|nr:hypothetical protein [Ruegeria lacuscaerulensis]